MRGIRGIMATMIIAPYLVKDSSSIGNVNRSGMEDENVTKGAFIFYLQQQASPD
jgi:hypothetical protein